jgi:hypothetical protein
VGPSRATTPEAGGEGVRRGLELKGVGCELVPEKLGQGAALREAAPQQEGEFIAA